MATSFSAYLTRGGEDMKQTDSNDTAKTWSHRESQLTQLQPDRAAGQG